LEKSSSANSDFFSGSRKVVDQKKKVGFSGCRTTFLEQWLQIKWLTEYSSAVEKLMMSFMDSPQF
jgi:hypothetical protein